MIVGVERRVKTIGFKLLAYHVAVIKNIECKNSRIFITAVFPPAVHDLFNSIVSHIIVGVDTGVQLGVDIFVGGVVRRVHTAVFFINIFNFKSVIGHRLPMFYKLGCIVGRAVVNNKPYKIL